MSTTGVAASSATNVWVFGQDGTTVFTRVYRFDGKRWHSISMPPETSFDSLDVLSPSDAWALGASFTSSSDLFHWNGMSWTGYTVPIEPFLSSLDASGPDNVWLAGIDSAAPATKGALRVYRWKGSHWARVTVPHLVVSSGPGVAAVSQKRPERLSRRWSQSPGHPRTGAQAR